jgi:hypothetical protein
MKSRLLVVLALAACSSDQAADDPPTPASTLTGKMPQHMRNCPSAVISAQTRSTPTRDGVDVFVTSSRMGAREEIVARAQRQAALAGPFPFVGEHSGHHGGPGDIGFCPIIHAGTTVSAEPITEGVRIHVAARSHADVAALQRATDARVRALARPAS